MRDNADSGGGSGDGTRTDFDPIPLPDDRVFTPFLEDKPPRSPEDLPHRSGYTIEHRDWDGALAQITIYFDKDGKVAGVVAEVIKDGISTIVAVEELIPGSLGLKKGDTRPVPDLGTGNKASTWDPKLRPDGSSGATIGGTQTTGGSSQNDSQPQQDSEPASGERANPGTSSESPTGGSNEQEGGTTGGTLGGTGEAPANGGEQQEQGVVWGPTSQEENGNTTRSGYTSIRVARISSCSW